MNEAKRIPATLDFGGGKGHGADVDMIWNTRRRAMDLTREGAIMGILNVTPDSFSDGGSFASVESAVVRAMEMVDEGAEIIDIGGESTRPGAVEVPEAEELSRVLPVIAALRARSDVLISIDTMKPSVAQAAVAAGADIINDVTGLADPEMLRVVAQTGAGAVLMHMRGTPRTMQVNPHYEDVVAEVRAFLLTRMEAAMRAGVDAEQIVLDPGIGFGKTRDHNLALLRGLTAFTSGARPVLMGVSRKSFISALTGADAVGDRDWPTVALTAFARERGVRLFRVHQARHNREALRMTEAIIG